MNLPGLLRVSMFRFHQGVQGLRLIEQGSCLLHPDGWKHLGVEETDLHEKRRLVPINVLVGDLAVLELHHHDMRKLHMLAVGLIPGSANSSGTSCVKLTISSSTTWSRPTVRETGTTLVSAGHFPMK